MKVLEQPSGNGLQDFFLIRSSAHIAFWLIVSLAFAGALSSLGVVKAFSGTYVIQDDARQYVMMLDRINDPSLFPNDFIADYYSSVAPPGFRFLYHVSAAIGLNPLDLNKILPLILALIATAYCFLFCLEIFPVPIAGFLASALLNENLWTKEDLSSATPRAFVYPLFLPFLYYLQKGSWIACFVCVTLQALFFPPAALICAGILIVRQIQKSKEAKSNLIFTAASIASVLIVLLIYSKFTQQYGPIIGRSEARLLPAFGAGGTQPYFKPGFWNYWITGWHSGILPYGMRPPLIWVGILLPISWRYRSNGTTLRLLWQTVLASLVLFSLAHAFLFKLYNPGRYAQHTLPIVFAVAAGISLAIIIQKSFQWRNAVAICLILTISVVLLIQFQNTYDFGYGYKTYLIGRHPELYDFFRRQPPGIRIASISRESDNLPAFAQRSTLVGREYALPYHTRYYHEIQKRGEMLLRAQYSADLSAAIQMIREYRVDYILLDADAFDSSYFYSNPWINVFQPAASEAKQMLASKRIPALQQESARCNVFQSREFIVIKGSCIGER